ncbi:MAG: diguanylate cyclase [Planctomycetota bacterium]
MTAVQSAAKTPSATVLVIDDDEACRVLLQSALEQSGHSVLVATERQEALGLFERHAIDLVVLDVHLEDSEGPKTCKSLREMPGGMHTPILILTETEDMQAVEAAFEAGANDFATKPLNYRLFSHRVQFLLRTARMASDLRLSEERLATAQRIARIGHWEWQIGAESLWCSRELRRLLGGAVRHAYQGLDLFLKLVHPDDRERVRKIYYEALRKREGFQVDHRIVLPDGSMRAIEQDVQVLPAAKGKPPRVLGIMHDVTDRWRVQHEVRKLSYYDQVTGLPNRTQLVERVTGWIKEETDGEQIALIWIDLDHFERINDTLGHGSGDQLLRCVADRLKLALLEAESHTLWQPPYDPRHKPIISRLGGDEFLIALPHVPTLDNVTLALESLRENIGMATRIQGTEIAVTSSIGVAVFPADGADMDTLMRNAGTAMHRAKNTGRNRYQFFKSEFSERALQHLAIETEMRRAIEDSQFFLEYQPKINLRDNRVEGMEALVRWQHPTLGLITPGDFVPVAEQNGMIVALGRWVLDHTWPSWRSGTRRAWANCSFR